MYHVFESMSVLVVPGAQVRLCIKSILDLYPDFLPCISHLR